MAKSFRASEAMGCQPSKPPPVDIDAIKAEIKAEMTAESEFVD